MDSSAAAHPRSFVLMWDAAFLNWMMMLCWKSENEGQSPSPNASLGFNILCSVQLLFASTCDVAGIPQLRQAGTEHTSHFTPAHRQTDKPTYKNRATQAVTLIAFWQVNMKVMGW